MLLRADSRLAVQALSVLHREVTLKQAQRRVLEAFSLPEHGEVCLPQHSLFSSTLQVRAAQWLAPRPTVDFEDCVAAYEDLADRSLGKVSRLDRVVYRILPRQHPDWLPRQFVPAWWVSAAAMLALISNVLGDPVNVDGEELLLEHDGLRFKVTANGIYSNFRGRFMYTERAKDFDSPLVSMPARVVRHPLATAVQDLPAHAQWAASYLLLCEEEKVIAPITSDTLLKVGLAKRGRRKGTVVHRIRGADRVAAVAGCREVLEYGGTLQDLYSVAVPYLMTSRQFKQTFACPWTHPEHGLTERLRSKFEETLVLLDREA